MKTKKTYNAPLMSIVNIETEDVIMASTLRKAAFNGAAIDAGKVYEIDITQ